MNVGNYSQIVFTRTDKGAEEIEKRTHRLAIRLRTLLLLVNGNDPVLRILEKAAGIGNGVLMLEELRTQGFIRDVDDGRNAAAPMTKAAPPADAALRGAVQTIGMWIHDMLGPDGDQIAEKLENARSAAELRQYLHFHRELLEMAAGKRRCDDFFQRVEAALDKNNPAVAAR